jgi:hypothetical protein
MQKTIILLLIIGIIIILFIIFFPLISNADCIVYFKNGRKIRADHCLDKDDIIKIEIWGGYVGIQKVDIHKIVNTQNQEKKYDHPIKRKRSRRY